MFIYFLLMIMQLTSDDCSQSQSIVILHIAKTNRKLNVHLDKVIAVKFMHTKI